MPILTIQKRLHEIGRIRLGERGAKGEPKRLTTFRLTSFDRNAIEAAAKIFGGEVQECTDKDLVGQFEVTTKVSEISIIAAPLPPTQFMEYWEASGCKRRCDGETELISGQPCMCDPGEQICKPTTRLAVILPDLPGLGVWRLETRGWHAASELVQSFQLLRELSGKQFAEGRLVIEERKQKKDGGVHKFIVPVIRISATPRQLMSAYGSEAAVSNEMPALNRPVEPKKQEPIEGIQDPVQEPIEEIQDPIQRKAGKNYRNAAFALLNEMGLPRHDGGHKAMYYYVFGRVLQSKSDIQSLSTLTQDEWKTIVAWLYDVKEGRKKMPAMFAAAIKSAQKSFDPMEEDATEETEEIEKDPFDFDEG